MTPKKTKGRQKIEMTKILDDKSLAVTFSKRYKGVFNKANELCTLCGVQIAIIMFSQSKKPVSYGNPSVGEIIVRYLEQVHPSNSRASQFVEAYRNANNEDLNKQFDSINAQVQAQKRSSEELDRIKKVRQEHGNWWDASIQTLHLEQLEKLNVSMLELKTSSEKQLERLVVEATNTTTGFASIGVDGVGPSA